MLRHICVACGLSPLIISAFSLQAVEPVRISEVGSAVSYALGQDAGLRAARLSVAQAEARLEGSGRLSNPELEVAYQSGALLGDADERGWSVGLSQRFPLARQLAKAKAVSRVGVARAKVELQQRELELAQSVADLALEIRLLDTRLALMQRHGELLRETAAFAGDKAASGEVSELEALQAKLDQERLANERAAVERSRGALQERMRRLLGFEGGVEIAFGVSPVKGAEIVDPLLGYDEGVLRRDADFMLAALAEEGAEAELALIAAERWDGVTARVFIDSERAIDEPMGPETERIVGVGLSIPLPVRRGSEYALREKRLVREQARLELVALQRKRRMEVENAHAVAEAARDRARSFAATVAPLAERQLDAATRSWRAGELGFIELLRQQEQRLQVENEYLDTLENYARTRRALERARNEVAGAKEMFTDEN